MPNFEPVKKITVLRITQTTLGKFVFPQTFRLRVYRCAQRVTVQERGGARAAGKGKLVRASVCKPERPGTRQTQIGRSAARQASVSSAPRLGDPLPTEGGGTRNTCPRARRRGANLVGPLSRGAVLLALLPMAGDTDPQVAAQRVPQGRHDYAGQR